MRKTLFPLLCLAFGFACHQNPKTEIPAMTAVKADTTRLKFTAAMVDNKKDPSCGMPVTAGIGDTTMYEGKLLGFCSKECKDLFLKNPATLISQAELK